MRWLTDKIGTGAFDEVFNIHDSDDDIIILDVRDLVDKSGNNRSYLATKIDEGLTALNKKKRVIVCCDYGMSRSNSIAVALLVKNDDFKFQEAVNLLREKVDEKGVKLEMLDSVYKALFQDKQKMNLKSVENILITGASGFVGRVVKESLSKKFNVFTPSSTEINLLENVLNLDLYVKSNEIDTIIHLANPKIFTTNDSMGETLIMLKNILDVSRINNIRITYLSGWEIYSGYKSHGLFVDDEFTPNPRGTYGETKWFGELLIKQYQRQYGLRYQIIRSGPVYGKNSSKPKFIYNFLNKALKNEEIITHKFSNGFPSLDLIYIDDFAEIVSKISTSDFQGDINIGSGTATSTMKIAELLKSATQSTSRISHSIIDDDAPNIIMDIKKAKDIFDWEPKVSIEDGILEIVTAQI